MAIYNEEKQAYGTARGERVEGEVEEREESEISIDPMMVVEEVSSFARENPHAALAGAFAVGFVLGGGLTPRLLGSIALVAGRAYLNKSVRHMIDDALREQLGAAEESGV